MNGDGADGRNRTGDLRITNALLYQLSYPGLWKTPKNTGVPLFSQEASFFTQPFLDKRHTIGAMGTAGAILLMGGEGQRFGDAVPKQFHLLGGQPLFCYALQTLLKSALFEEVLLVCHPDWMDFAAKYAGGSVRVVAGGKTRQESSWRGIQQFLRSPDIILIHDAVRPFVTERILKENIQVAREQGAADTCIPSADTLVYAPGGRGIASIPKREEFLRGQTPQTFRSDWIREAHLRAQEKGIQNASDDCRLVLEMGRPVAVVLGDESNLKITTALDLWMAEQFLGYRILGVPGATVFFPRVSKMSGQPT